MDWTRSGDDLFLRLDPGDEIHSSIRSLADEVGFNAAVITSGIGRTRLNEYGFMDDDHVYHRRSIAGPAELVTLQGNLARLEDGAAFTHLHATFADDAWVCRSGHLFEATVEVVAEIHIRIMSHAVMTRCPVADSEFVALRFD